MLDFWRSSKYTLYRTGLLVWHNLFKVLALFILAMTVFLTANYYWVVFSPTDNYLQYHNLSVADVEQGRRAVATVCYEVNERHSAEGEAVFYVENQKGDRVYDSQVEFDFTLSGDNPCEQEFIPTQTLEPGVYYLHLIRTIRIQTLVPFTAPVEKKADVAATDTFTVREKTYTKAEMQAAIGDINKRISELNKKLGKQGEIPIPPELEQSPQPPVETQSTPQPAPTPKDSTPAPQQPRPVIEPQRPTSQPTPQPTQSTPQQRPQGLIGGTLDGVSDLVIDVLNGVRGIL